MSYLPKRNPAGGFLVPVLGMALCVSAPSIQAERSYLGTWSDIYPASSSDTNANCALCHNSYSSGDGLNPYGRDIADSNAGGISSRIVDVGGIDSDEDPTNSDNLVEINANAQPGWTGSAPDEVIGDLDPVVNQAPIADANGPYSGIVDVDVVFDGTGSSDSDGIIQSYAWDFGDGATGSGPMPAHAYADAGTYQVILTVTDNDGATDTAGSTAEIGLANVPPIADANGPYSGTVDIAVNFDATGSTDPDGNIVAYDWDFGDGTTGSGPTPSHTYTTSDTYTVALMVTDDAGAVGQDETTATIGAGNLPPVADVGGPYAGLTGELISFDGSGSSDPDGTVEIYDWDFGDGTLLFDGGPNPTHAYALSGTYNVTLTVTDNDGVSDSAATTASVSDVNQAPVADPAGPYLGTVDIPVSFDGTGSTDADGTIVSYSWNFGDGNTGSGATPSHTYTTAGTFNVSLTVTDDAGDSDTAGTTASIGTVNIAPIADANGPYAGTVGVAVIFDAGGSNDPDGTIVSYDWDFGDGSSGSGPMPSHTYSAEGTYTVSLVVTDDAGDTGADTTSASISVENQVPVADANGPYTGTVGVPVTFDASGSSDPDGSIVGYSWDFGDGSTGLGVAPSHTYTTADSYTVSLTVTDDAGASASDQTSATIGLGNLPPTADAGGPYSGTVGVSVAFDGSGSSDPDGNIVNYDWDFGDGTILMDGGPTPNHVYQTAGTFNVTLTVTDDAGASDSAATTAGISSVTQPPVEEEEHDEEERDDERDDDERDDDERDDDERDREYDWNWWYWYYD